MKAKISLGELSAAWSILSTAVPQRSTRPILSNVKITCTDTIELAATDLDIGIRYILDEAEVIEGGEILVNAEKISRILRENPSDRVELEASGGVTKLSYNNDVFQLPGDETGNFPQVEGYQGKDAITVEKGVLEILLRQSAFAAAHGETRYALNGVLFEVNGSHIVAVATDGKRLSWVKGKCKGDKGVHFKALVPLKGVQVLEKILAHSGEEIELAADEGSLYARTNKAEVVCRLLEGSFPEYEDVIPKGYETKVELKRLEWSSKLRLAEVFTAEESKAVKILFDKDGLTITAEGPDTGEARVVMAAEYASEPIEIAFNPQYFLDALKVLTEETVVLELQDSHSSAKMTVGDSFAYVVMPLSLD